MGDDAAGIDDRDTGGDGAPAGPGTPRGNGATGCTATGGPWGDGTPAEGERTGPAAGHRGRPRRVGGGLRPSGARVAARRQVLDQLVEVDPAARVGRPQPVHRVVELFGGPSGRAIRSLLGAAIDDPVLQEGCRRLPLADWDQAWETVVGRAEERGEAPRARGGRWPRRSARRCSRCAGW